MTAMTAERVLARVSNGSGGGDLHRRSTALPVIKTMMRRMAMWGAHGEGEPQVSSLFVEHAQAEATGRFVVPWPCLLYSSCRGHACYIRRAVAMPVLKTFVTSGGTAGRVREMLCDV